MLTNGFITSFIFKIELYWLLSHSKDNHVWTTVISVTPGLTNTRPRNGPWKHDIFMKIVAIRVLEEFAASQATSLVQQTSSAPVCATPDRLRWLTRKFFYHYLETQRRYNTTLIKALPVLVVACVHEKYSIWGCVSRQTHTPCTVLASSQPVVLCFPFLRSYTFSGSALTMALYYFS